MTPERAFTCMFADVTSEMFASGKDHPTIAETSTLKHGNVAAAFRLLTSGILWRSTGLAGWWTGGSALLI